MPSSSELVQVQGMDQKKISLQRIYLLDSCGDVRHGWFHVFIGKEKSTGRGRCCHLMSSSDGTSLTGHTVGRNYSRNRTQREFVFSICWKIFYRSLVLGILSSGTWARFSEAKIFLTSGQHKKISFCVLTSRVTKLEN